MDTQDLFIIARILLERGRQGDVLSRLELYQLAYMLANIANSRDTFTPQPGVPSQLITGEIALVQH